MARTIAERIRRSARGSFVGRVNELDVLREAVLAEELPFVVAYVHGPGGIGKSRFVRTAVEAVSPPATGLYFDCAQIEPTPDGFLRAEASAGASIELTPNGRATISAGHRGPGGDPVTQDGDDGRALSSGPPGGAHRAAQPGSV